MEHKCIIGIWYDHENTNNVTLTSLEKCVEREREVYNELKLSRFNTQPFKLEDYFNLRKNTNLERYNYCPVCGEKIDWKRLKSIYKNY